MMHIMKLMIPKVLGNDNKKVSKIQVMTLGHSWSLHNEPDESIKLDPRYSWCLHCPMNEMKWST